LWKADELYKPDWEYYKHAKKSELSYDTARILKEHAESIGLGWFASVHTKEDIDFLVNVKAPFIKIKASQSKDRYFRKYAIDTNIKVIISHSENFRMSTIRSVNINSWKMGSGQLITTSKYPSKFSDIPFNQFKNKYISGFSDHTQGIQASLCAAMYSNIRIFERHFSANLEAFDVDWTGTPDYCVSLFPLKFAEMVRKIKHIKGE